MTLDEAKRLLEQAKNEPSKAANMDKLKEAIKVVTNTAIKKPQVD